MYIDLFYNMFCFINFYLQLKPLYYLSPLHTLVFEITTLATLYSTTLRITIQHFQSLLNRLISTLSNDVYDIQAIFLTLSPNNTFLAKMQPYLSKTSKQQEYKVEDNFSGSEQNLGSFITLLYILLLLRNALISLTPYKLIRILVGLKGVVLNQFLIVVFDRTLLFQ